MKSHSHRKWIDGWIDILSNIFLTCFIYVLKQICVNSKPTANLETGSVQALKYFGQFLSLKAKYN